jgi:release factor glutamine methyltransferase
MAPTIRELFSHGVAELEKLGAASPAAEAGILLEHVCHLPPLELGTSSRPATPAEIGSFDALLRRRTAHQPVQYLVGRAFFHDIELEVSPAVLIPRPETELLVDRVLELLPAGGSLLDLGTGSGAIALAVAHHRPDAGIVGADISPEALRVARRNRDRLGASNVELVCSDLFSALAERRFDVIAANLPYVPEEDRDRLAPEVAEHEPALALFAAEHGTGVIRRALAELKDHLAPGGHALFELDPRQASEIAERMKSLGFSATIRRDLAGRDRFVEGVSEP